MRSKETQIPEETYHSLMRAVLVALDKHGYGDLTMRNIAAEFDKSRGLLHYHFEDKDELLAEVWEFVFERYTRSVAFDETMGAEDRIRGFLSVMLFGTDDAEIDHWTVQTALLEFRMLARHDEWLRERVDRVERRRIDILAGFVAAGVESGDLRAVDPESTAAFLVGAADAARIRRITLGWDEAPEQCWHTLTEVVLPALRR